MPRWLSWRFGRALCMLLQGIDNGLVMAGFRQRDCCLTVTVTDVYPCEGIYKDPSIKEGSVGWLANSAP